MRPGDCVADRFVVEFLAGSGGMGKVYRATDSATGELVALKVIHGDADPDFARFERESAILSQLRHPGIVRYVARGVTENHSPFLAMEWLDGEDLESRLRTAPLDVDQSITLVARAAEAVGAAHVRGIIHRDLKPANIFLADGDPARPKVLDFGIARARHPTHAVTRTGAMIGTPGYMSPEQVRGDRGIDARADVFSLGCVLFECLTGRPAFVGESLFALLAKILVGDVPDVRQLRPELAPDIAALVARFVDKEPSERPLDAAIAARELEALRGLPGERPAPRSHRPQHLTESEQAIVSIVLVAPNLVAGDTRSLQTDATMLQDGAAGDWTRLGNVASRFGARVDHTAEGPLVVTLSGSGAATDAAARAARCALTLRDELPGSLVVLATGRGRLAGRVLGGDVIDRAARLLDWARFASATPAALSVDRGVRIDDITAALLDTRFDVARATAGFLLRGVANTDAGGRRLLVGRDVPCVGRDRDLRTLDASFDECALERMPTAVLVTGDAGVGKSRLATEFLRRVRQREENVLVLSARADPVRSSVSLGLLAQALRPAFGLREGDPLELRRQRLTDRVARHVTSGDQPRVSAFLGELLGAPFDDAHLVQLREARRDPMVMGDQMRRAWEDWLGAECAHRPVVMVLDDLQWSDAPTVQFVDAALRNLAEAPWLILALARPGIGDVFPRVWQERHVLEVRLGPLSRRAAEKLVREAIGGNAADDTVRQVVDRGAGNAFFLEELVRAVAEGRGDSFPETVLAMVQARLQMLEPNARRVLRAASVFGQVFWRGAVASLLTIDDADSASIHAWIDELVARELIEAQPPNDFQDEPAYAFRQALVREASYAMLTDDDRPLGHRLAGAWLEAMGSEDSAVLAGHFEQGLEPSRALRWYLRAVEDAFESHDLAAVLVHAESAVRCGAKGEVVGHLRMRQAVAHRWRGEYADADRRSREAAQLLRPGSDPWLAAIAETAQALGRLGRNTELADVTQSLLDHDIEQADAERMILSYAHVIYHLYNAGLASLADALIVRIDALHHGLDKATPAVFAAALSVHALQLMFAGDLGGFIDASSSALASLHDAGDLRTECIARVGLGFACKELGDFQQAEQVLRTSMREADRMGLGSVSTGARHNLGPVLARMGKLEEAREIELQAIRVFEAQDSRRLLAVSHAYLADVELAAGDLDAAERHARAAIDVAPDHSPAQTVAVSMLAEVMLAKGLTPEGLEESRRAMDLLGRVGALSEGEARIRLVHARALQGAGLQAEAHDALADAGSRLMANAGRITNAAWRESFLRRVPENEETVRLAGSG